MRTFLFNLKLRKLESDLEQFKRTKENIFKALEMVYAEETKTRKELRDLLFKSIKNLNERRAK